MRRLPIPPRWKKLLQDLRAEKSRLILMLAAIAVSLLAVGAVMGAFAVLSREIGVNYLGTRPASATLEIPAGVDGRVLEVARSQPGIAVAEGRDVLQARARVGEDWRPLLLFVVEDFRALQVNTFTPTAGAWPPPPGGMLVERTAVPVLAAGLGGRVRVRTAHGPGVELPVSGLVHDPGLAPATQERSGYGYIARETLPLLGEPAVLHELRITLADAQAGLPAIEACAAGLAKALEAEGREVHEIRVPPPRQHPHQRQMQTILFMMLAFSFMALGLSGVLVATSLSAMLARQVREIGVMKTLGATASQLAGMYAALVAALGAVAVVAALPAGYGGAQVLAGAIADLLNFTLTARGVPWWVYAVQAAAGILVPLAVAALPIRQATRLSVRQAIERHGASADALGALSPRLPWPLRNALRRPARLALTVVLLAGGGAMFMTALNVSAGWERNVAKVYETRHYDIEVRFHEAQPETVAEAIQGLPGVRAVEAWGYSPSAFSRPGQVDVVRTYPDRGHASFSVMAPPPGTQLIRFPVLAGRWLREDDRDAVVLNHTAAAARPGLRIGDPLNLSLGGKATTWRLAGIVEEIGSPGAAYVTDHAFARLAGTRGRARLLRIATEATTPEVRQHRIRAIERKLAEVGAGVETAWPLAELRTAMADHISILIRSLAAMAVVIATVGALGLSSTMGTSVLERTREFAVMKTLGATPARVTRQVVQEALFMGALSWVAALLLSVPLTAWLDALIGRLGFVAPLPFILSAGPMALWLGILGLVTLAATLLPARRAASLSVAEALVRL
ncbi:MAG: FtsX-like permease family protein [Acidobacteria bacterium]|nr:FtsX-like permease family protein [Acidobacteriota bacterium]